MATIKKYSNNPIRFLGYYICRKTGNIFKPVYKNEDLTARTYFMLKFDRHSGKPAIYVSNRPIDIDVSPLNRINIPLQEVSVNDIHFYSVFHSKWSRIRLNSILTCIHKRLPVYVDLT